MLKVVYSHYHEGNDPNCEHRVPLYEGKAPPKYVTAARLIDSDSGIPFEEAWAYCSPNDVPNRARGRSVARGRLLKILKWKKYEGLENIWDTDPKGHPRPDILEAQAPMVLSHAKGTESV